ncbi:MAG: RusA family crossover junction endodeoxyribonuclease [Pseudomonadota bacterium]
MMQIQFTVPGQPEAKGRPRFRIMPAKGGADALMTVVQKITAQRLPASVALAEIKSTVAQHQGFVSTYTPPETVKNEERIARFAKVAMAGAAPCAMPIEILVELRMQIPVSWSKKKQVAAAAGTVRATKKPDLDNCAKSVLDACNGIVFADDGQVVQLTVRKLYHAVPAVVVAIRSVEGGAA